MIKIIWHEKYIQFDFIYNKSNFGTKSSFIFVVSAAYERKDIETLGELSIVDETF